MQCLISDRVMKYTLFIFFPKLAEVSFLTETIDQNQYHVLSEFYASVCYITPQ